MLSLLCSCGGGSFRSGVQPPTGSGPTGTGRLGACAQGWGVGVGVGVGGRGGFFFRSMFRI